MRDHPDTTAPDTEDAEYIARSRRPLSEFIREQERNDDIKWVGRHVSPGCPDGHDQCRNRRFIETGTSATNRAALPLLFHGAKTASRPIQTNPAPAQNSRISHGGII
jgi:hypothetical protein